MSSTHNWAAYYMMGFVNNSPLILRKEDLMENKGLKQQFLNLQETADQLYWMAKYAYLGALHNQDENSALFGAIEQMADMLNLKITETKDMIFTE